MSVGFVERHVKPLANKTVPLAYARKSPRWLAEMDATTLAAQVERNSRPPPHLWVFE
jgi:replication-associated recombination protein RarA